MWGSLNIPFEDGFEVMKEELELDTHFRDFHDYCVKNDIPFNVISAGLKPVLRRVLDTFLGEEAVRHTPIAFDLAEYRAQRTDKRLVFEQSSKIDIVANDAEIKQDGSEWKPIWRHDTELGHDKAASMVEAREQAELACDDGTVPLIVFIGDGVSDLPAANQADVLFARRGLRLEEYCQESAIPYVPFDTFEDIKNKLEEIAEEDRKATGGRGVPKRFNPRADLWRRVSSRQAVPLYVVSSPSKEERMFLWPEVFSELKTPAIEPAAMVPPPAVAA